MRPKLAAFSVLTLMLMPMVGASAAPVCRSELAGVNERCPVWTAAYNHLEGRGGNGEDIGRAITMSPSGNRVYVTGQSYDDVTSDDQAVAAFDASTGQRVWASRYETPDFDTGSAIAATASSVFVTGRSGPAGNLDWATSAYDATTGLQRWVVRYAGPKRVDDTPYGIGVSADGSVVFVTGGVDDGVNIPGDILTVAYRAADGQELWADRFDDGSYDGSFILEMAPDGKTVYVAGQSRGASNDAVTLAYDAVGPTAGHLRWVGRLDNANRSEYPEGLAVSADGRRVALTSTSRSTPSTADADYATAVFDAATGAQVWRKTYNGGRNLEDVAGGVAIADDAVVVTGRSAEQPAGSDYGTVAYDLETGAVRWSKLQNSVAHFTDSALDIVAAPNGDRVFVTGYFVVPRGEIQPIFKIEPGATMTVAYDTATGNRSWVALHNESGVGNAVAVDAVVSPDNRRVYVAGTFIFSGVYLYPVPDAKPYAYDFGVIAYDA